MRVGHAGPLYIFTESVPALPGQELQGRSPDLEGTEADGVSCKDRLSGLKGPGMGQSEDSRVDKVTPRRSLERHACQTPERKMEGG